MNRLIILGNGFDIAHGLPTKYNDFITWYICEWYSYLKTSNKYTESDSLCTFSLNDHRISWQEFFQTYSTPRGKDFIGFIKRYPALFDIKYSSFMSRISNSIENRGWVDIENEYYSLLKEYVDAGKSQLACDLNDQLDFIREKLTEYLLYIQENMSGKFISDEIKNLLIEPFSETDIAIEYLHNPSYSEEIKAIEDGKEFPETSMILDFNYTNTSDYYSLSSPLKTTINHIHGCLKDPDSMIFGYGDELDDEYQKLLKSNNNNLLSNIKSIRYLESDNYRKLLEFIEYAPYQIYIMGHSCGTSDRTMLNTLFEHRNCVSIKPFYYEKDDGSDNYLEIVQNISRNFTNMKLMRDRVVNKQYCTSLPQIK